LVCELNVDKAPDARYAAPFKWRLITHGGRISLKKSHKIILLIIGILIMLAVIAFGLKSAYRLGQQDALREENKQTNQRAK
jgi:hypothetical protein